MVEAFVTAIGFPRTAMDFAHHVLKNLETEVAADRRYFDLELVLNPPSYGLHWSVPSWARPDDVAVFYVAGRMTSYVKEIRRDIDRAGISVVPEMEHLRSDMTARFSRALDRAVSYAEEYAGKFIAVGRVRDFPEPGVPMRIRDRLFASIDDVTQISPPIEYARLKDTFTLRPQATITRLRSNAWSQLLTLVGSNSLPAWAAAAKIGPDSLPEEMRGDWRSLVKSDVFRCKSEDEFREHIVDRLLDEIADEGQPVLHECVCVGSRGIIDSVLKIAGKWIAVEVKQRIPESKYLLEQVRAYLGKLRIVPRRGLLRGTPVDMGRMRACLVVDAAGIYVMGRSGLVAGSYAEPAFSLTRLAAMTRQEIRAEILTACGHQS